MNKSHNFSLLEKLLLTAVGITQVPVLSFAQDSDDKRIHRIEQALIKIKNDNDRIALKIANLNKQLGSPTLPPLWERVSAKTAAIQSVWAQLEQSALKVELEAKKKAYLTSDSFAQAFRTTLASNADREYFDKAVDAAIFKCFSDTQRTDFLGIKELEDYDTHLDEVARRANGPETIDREWD